MLAQRKRAIVSVLTTLLVVVACSGPAVTPAVVSVAIDDGSRSVMAGSTLALTATVVAVGGASEAVLWSSDEPNTATVSSAGVITGVAPGEARITATSALDATKSDTITITVTPPPATPEVLSVSIDGGERSVLVGETLQLSATVTTVGGASDAVTWTSGDTGIATISTTGLVSGITVGQALITATSAFDTSMRDSTLISVVSVPPGAPARISVVTGDNQTATVGSAVPIPPTVRVRDTDDNPLSGISVTFTITAGNGTVAPTAPVTTNADGIAALSSWTLGTTAGANGVRANVTGTSPAISTTFNATGLPGPASPQTSTITANPTSLLANGTATSQLAIQLKDAYGNDLTSGGATVTFATPTQGSIGTVTDHGNGTYSATYTAGTTAGTITITPRVNGMNFTNTTTITLTAAVTSVTINQTNPSVWAGDNLQLTATVETIGGASTAVTWTSSNTSVATINPTTGLLTGITSGTTTITATSTANTSKKGSTTLTVREPMILTVDTNLGYGDKKSVTLDLLGNVDVTVEWGDGLTTSTTTSGVLTHTYATAGIYDITIRGTLSHFAGADYVLTSLTAWGDLGLTSLANAFWGAHYLTTVPKTVPPTVTDMSSMFSHSGFNGDISGWDVSNVRNMAWMFRGMDDAASPFNQDISRWDVSNVTDMRGMFNWTVFNQDIGGWDVSNVTSMDFMFMHNGAFNQDIGDWDVSKVTTMSYMFGAGHSGPTSVFDQDISRWDVSNVTDLDAMFAFSRFNQDIGAWNVSNVTNMYEMFYYAAFNQDIGGWNVANVTDMDGMFAYSRFNQDIGAWNVSNVTSMAYMFYSAAAFNQNLAGWCVINIPAEPSGFASYADAWILPKPVWGTCPTD